MLCPIVTSLEGGEVNENALSSLTEFILENGVDGLFPCGTTGEFASLAPDPRRQVISTVAQAAGDAPVITRSTRTSIPETHQFMEVAEAAGADAAAIVGPYFHTANGSEGTRQFFKGVADETALVLYLYNILMYVGVSTPKRWVRSPTTSRSEG